MARYSNVQTDFSGGLISDYILGRSDIERTAKSAREFTNFLPTLQGPAEYRYGFKHVNKLTETDEDKTVTAPLTLSTNEVYRVAFSNTKIKVYDSAGQLKVSTATVLTGQINDTSDTIVFTLPTGHGYVVGDRITITGSSNSNMNATHTVTAVTDTSATIVISSYGSATTDPITITKDYLTSPYSLAELDDLRFSSETDALYITHPLHRPARLFPLSDTVSYTLTASGGEFLYGDKTGDRDPSDYTDVSVDDELLQSNVAVVGDTKWYLQEIAYDVEPLLEADTSSSQFRITNNESYAKVTSTTNDFAYIVTSIADLTVTDGNVADAAGDTITITLPTGHGLLAGDSITISGSNNANLNVTINVNTATATAITIVIGGYSGNNDQSIVIDRTVVATRLYVQYTVQEETFLGQVVVAATSTNYTLANPTNTEVYVTPVNVVVDIEDPTARLYLLDNEETSDAEDISILTQDGVPDNKIHLRSDATIFNQGLKNAWILVDDDRRASEVARGHTRSTSRWVKIKDHLGTQDHPVEFNRGANFLKDKNLTAGSVYKILSDNGATTATSYFVVSPSTDGDLEYNAGVVTLPSGNRTFTFVNRLSSVAASSSALGGTEITGNADQIVANLTTSKQLDVVECYNFTDDGVPKVEEYNASSNPTGNLIVPPVSDNVTVVTVANDVILNSTAPSFVADDLNRHFRGELPSGHIYMKAVRFISGNQIVVEVLNKLPRNSRTLEIENLGSFTSFSFGAWYKNNFPKTVTKYEQRRVYGGTFSHPNYVFFSRADNEYSFQATQDDKTVLDTDGITYILTNQTASIKWLDALKDLVIGTTGGLYRVVPNEYLYGVSAKTIRIELTQEEPCNAQAISVGNSIFYPDQAGGRVLEYRYDQAIQNSASNDVSKLIYPTFVHDGIVKIQYQHTPQPRIWAVTKNGNLYCLAYHRQEEVYAWTKMDLAGATVHDITVLNTGNGSLTDSVFAIVTRNNSTTVVSTECFNESKSEYVLESTKVAAHLDAYVVNIKGAINNVSLDVSSRFVDGDTVSVVIDGEYKGDYTVASGVPQGLASSADYKVFIAGVKYEGVAKPMFPTWDGQNKPAYGADTQRIVSIKPFVIDSFSYSVGINGQFKDISLSTTYGVGNGFTGFDTERPVAGSTFGVDNIPTFKQTKPYPLVIASIITKTDLN